MCLVLSGSHIIVVSVGKDLNMVELEGIASEPKDFNIYRVESISTLPSIQQQIITSFCDGKFTEYCMSCYVCDQTDNHVLP